MNCPVCKTETLVPARTRENSPEVDGRRCARCSGLWRLDKTNHLVLVEAPSGSVRSNIKLAPPEPQQTPKNWSNQLFDMLVQGIPVAEIAKKLDMHQSAIYSFRNRHEAEIIAAGGKVQHYRKGTRRLTRCASGTPIVKETMPEDPDYEIMRKIRENITSEMATLEKILRSAAQRYNELHELKKAYNKIFEKAV